MSVSIQRTITGTEPVALADAKLFLRVDFDDDDALITSLITAAREHAEQVTGRCLIASTYTYWLDAFPYGWQDNSAPARTTIQRFASWWANAQTIEIPRPPLVSITSVQYIPSTGGGYITLDPSLYTVDASGDPAVIYPTIPYYWPWAYTVHNAVQIQFTAGYTNVPQQIITAINLLIAGWYEHRIDGTDATPVADALLRPYRTQPCGILGR